MPSSYLTRAASPLVTPQSEPIPGSTQVQNSAGGFTWQIDPMERLRRFLVLGSEGGTYYASERDLTRQNLDGVRKALDEHGTEAVAEIITISESGRAPKNDPALYALAMAAAHASADVRAAALAALPKVARTGTHLFHFADFVQSQRGWGPALCKAVAAWYEREDVDQLAYQAIKYRQRDGWTHRDLLRLAHPSAPSAAHRDLYEWLCRPDSPVEHPSLLAFREAQAAQDARATAALIVRHGNRLPREALRTEHLNEPVVWEALLEAGMPMTAMLRNLATMTRIGVLRPMTAATHRVVEQLANEEAIRKARIHPLSVLGALATYASGRSARGDATWEPLREIVDALDGAFYLAFGNVEPTRKRTLLALDVSGSMTMGQIGGMPGISPRVGSAAMALVTAAVEPHYHVLAFCHQLVPVDISPRERLDDVLRKVSGLPFGGTDCALPMLWASRMQTRAEIDTFIVYTDNETWFGSIHPAQALAEYRKRSGIDAKLIVVGMTATPFSIAHPNDRGMMDVVGFDAAAPQVMADFALGRV